MDVKWIHGSPSKKDNTQPKIQIFRYAESTFILRQSKSVNYEAPFLFLLFGTQRALLLDTGATAEPELFPLRETVDELVAKWLAEHPCEGYELIVAHTHGHNDHVAADGQFADRPDTTVVPVDVDSVRSFFGFGDSWPAQTVTFSLGDRELEILGAPGHHKASIAVYDPATGLLLTGDSVLPGRIFVFDHAAFLATLDRLVAFAATRPVSHVLGCHVEMKDRPRQVYPIGATYQPRERSLEMTTVQLKALRDAMAAVTGKPGVHWFDDFVIYNEPRKRDWRWLLFRGRLHELRRSVFSR